MCSGSSHWPRWSRRCCPMTARRPRIASGGRPACWERWRAPLHPWHGEVLIVVVLGAELAMWWGQPPMRGRLARPALTVVMTVLPLAYYALLEQTDGSWRLGRVASNHTFPLWSILLEIAPLLLPALLAYHGRPRSFLTAATRVWPIAALAVFVVSATALGATPCTRFKGSQFRWRSSRSKASDVQAFAGSRIACCWARSQSPHSRFPQRGISSTTRGASSPRDQAHRISSRRTSTARSIT